MYHMHRPQKNQCRIFFPLRHTFHFLEMEQLSLYTFLPNFRSMPGAPRAMTHVVIRNSRPQLLFCRTLHWLFFRWEMVLSSLLHITPSNSSEFKCHLLQEALPHSPMSYGLSLPFAPMTLYQHLCFGIYHLPLCRKDPYLPSYILVL